MQASGTGGARNREPLLKPPTCHPQYIYGYMRPAWLSRYSSHDDGEQTSIREHKAGLVPRIRKGDAHEVCPTGPDG